MIRRLKTWANITRLELVLLLIAEACLFAALWRILILYGYV